MMDRKTSSILDELCNSAPRDRDLFVEARAQQLIASANNFMRLLESSYDDETAEELKRRLFNSIKSGDEMKFRRKIREIRKGNHEKETL